jgi:hypothetical protein
MGGGGGILSPVTNALFGSPSQPATPNYTAAAQATASGNLDAARQATAANRVNQVTPYGNLNYAITGEDPYGNPTWTATQSLSPEQQQIYNYDTQTALGLGALQNTGLSYVGQMLNNPFSTSSLPTLQSGVSNPNLSMVGQGPQMGTMTGSPQFQNLGQAEQAQRMGNAPQLGQVGQAGQLQTQVGGGGMEGWDQATALLNSRLQPQMALEQKALDTKLANQGIPVGSEAYNRAKGQLNMKQNDMAVQSQLQAQGLQQNLFNNALQSGNFANTAINQGYQNQLAGQGFNNQAMLGQNQAQLGNVGLNNQAINQNYANQQAMLQQQNANQQQQYANQYQNLGFNNQQAQQQYSNQLAQQAANNTAQNQMFNNAYTNAGLANAARQQGFNELAYQRNEPINTLNAVRSGAQVTNPNFVNAPQQATTSGADYLGAMGLSQQNEIANANAQNAQTNAMMGGLFSLGGAGIAKSDIRTKENIVKIGIAENGLPLYIYEYKPEFKDDPLAGHGKFVGHMAHEVEAVIPEAVITTADGYKAVDYRLV